jgi:hypothetical protein
VFSALARSEMRKLAREIEIEGRNEENGEGKFEI